jgi:7-cyano-7-deazaguanine synthase
MKSLALFSGGLDSTVLLTELKTGGYLGDRVHALSVYYGQRHVKELEAAALICGEMGVPHDVADLTAIRHLLSGSALTDDSVPVPDGHYAEESMRATVVPNRNAIMLSVAAGVAVAQGAAVVATAVHTGDHFIYPDCRPAFISAISQATRFATEGFGDVSIQAPFIHKSKADIVRLGAEIDAPMADTWSCYKGGAIHCGACGTCFERREAFKLAGVADPTEYAATPDFAAP